MPLICWNCNTILDIVAKNENIITDAVFVPECRKCGDIEAEKKPYLIKEINE